MRSAVHHAASAAAVFLYGANETGTDDDYYFGRVRDILVRPVQGYFVYLPV
jgi:hypothetical protein